MIIKEMSEIQTSPPVAKLPPKIAELLARHGDLALSKAEAILAQARPCIYVTSERVSQSPMRRGLFGRILGLPVVSPVLSSTASKFGGTPYVSQPHDLDLEGCSFLGQVNFADLPRSVPELPKEGILVIDWPLHSSMMWPRTRYYADPDPAKCLLSGAQSVGYYEARLVFRFGWSLPAGREWFDAIPAGDPDLWTAWNEWNPAGYNDDEYCHRIGGNRSAGLDNHYGFAPQPGRSSDIRDYEMLLRITFDNDADFAFGTNCLYVIIHHRDLADGRLDQAVATGANY